MNAVRVLFVDDDPNVLESLRHLLRRRQREWEMEFVLSGAEALAMMASQPFDAIVTDMQMPEMDGVELLERVKRQHPGTARVVLSGHAGRTAVLRSLSLAHRFLSKPCAARTIVSVVDATLQLHLEFDPGSGALHKNRDLVARLTVVVSEEGDLGSQPGQHASLLLTLPLEVSVAPPLY